MPKMWKWLWNWVIGGTRRIFEAHDRKGLDCLERDCSRNMEVKAILEVSDEMRNMFLNPQRKAILVTKWWKKTWLNCVLLLGGK